VGPVAARLGSISTLQRSACDQYGEAAEPDACTWGCWDSSGLGAQLGPVAGRTGRCLRPREGPAGDSAGWLVGAAELGVR